MFFLGFPEGRTSGELVLLELGKGSGSLLGSRDMWLRSSSSKRGWIMESCAYRKGSRTPEPFQWARMELYCETAIHSDVDPKSSQSPLTWEGGVSSMWLQLVSNAGRLVSVSCHPAL